MNRRWPLLLLVPTMLLLFAGPGFAGLGAAIHTGTALQPPTCQQLQFHVALAPGLPWSAHIRESVLVFGATPERSHSHADHALS